MIEARKQPVRKKINPMSEDQVKAILDAHIHDSMGYIGGELTKQRGMAMDYYLGEPFGNEIDGRSKVVSTDVADTIEWIMPSLMRTFTACDDAVIFDPVGPEDTDAAQQETDYVNHVFYKKNHGFLILYQFIKDALLQKNGITKSFWEEIDHEEREEYFGLSEEQFVMMMQDDSLEAIAKNDNAELLMTEQGPVEFKTVDVVFKRKSKKGQIRVINIPPEDFLISKGYSSINLDDAPFIAHRGTPTASALLEMGVPQEKIDKLPDAKETEQEEKIKRNNLNDERDLSQDAIDKSTRKITVYECYIRIDEDGDGIAELRKILKAGNEILRDEPVDSQPFDAITPIILCHKFFGLSIADLVMDLQLIKSTILRQMLDNMYLTNNSRNAINKDIVNLDDLLTSRPGGIVRCNGDPSTAIVPLVTQPLSDSAFRMMEYIDRIREGRSGVSQMSMGLNNSLLTNNKGDQSVDRVMTAAEQRIELVARIFAETGIKSLFLRIHEILLKHQDKKAVVQLRGKWVDVNPAEWRTRTDMTVNVGLGTGERQQLVQAVMGVIAMQREIIANGGESILVTMPNIYKALVDIAKYSGIKNPEQYYQDPKSQEAQAAMQEKQQKAEEAKQTDPNLLFVKVEAQKNEVTAQKNSLEHQRKMMELETNYRDKEAKMQEQMKKQVDDIAVKLTELELKYNSNVPGSLV
jgi:hypothetical protein